MLPSPGELRARIDQAMTADRPRLRARLESLRGKGDLDAASRLADDVAASVARAEERRRSRPVPRFDLDLPVIARRDEVAAAIRDHQVIVLCGETGSGKTTQLPQICLDLGRGCAGLIGHTQPRRIAARAVAQRIADELRAPLGPRGPVGYAVRFSDESSPANYIKLMTDGILLAEIAGSAGARGSGDRSLDAYDTLIIDEAHERSLNIDFLLGYLKQLLPRRPDLKLIITSATIDPQRLSTHFGGPAVCPIIEVSGRTFPVEVRYRPTTDLDADDWDNVEELAILDAVDELSRADAPDRGRGDILVFLPGEREIRQAAEALRKHHPPGTEILPLYARLSPAEQMRVFEPHPNAERRVILATNVAETSLTVPGIRSVIDTGLARISRYSHRAKVQRLPIEPISQASANQRSGRCGRVAAGVAIRLYSEDDFKARPAFTDPEILRTNLASVILQMKALRLGPVEAFPFVEPPDARMIRDGYETLEELGAVDDSGELTPVGRQLARIPVDPRIGRILLAAADEGALPECLIICSALEVQDPRDRPMDKQAAADQAQARFRHDQSDFLTFLNIWDAYHEQAEHLTHSKLRAWCREHFLNFMRMREWVETHRQLKAVVADLGLVIRTSPAAYDQVHRALLTGLLSSVCSKNDAGGGFDYHGPRGAKVSIFPGSALFKKGPRWFVAAEIVQTTRLYARTLAKIEPEWIERLAAHVVKRSHTDPHWSRETGQACAWERVTLFGLVLVPRRRVALAPIDPAAARAIFIHHALVEGEWPPGRTPAPFEEHNRLVLESARRLEAKLRRSGVAADLAVIAAFYDRRLPPEVLSVGTLDAWLRSAAPGRDPSRALRMTLDDLLAPESAPGAPAGHGALDAAFPDELRLADDPATRPVPIEYLFEPGRDADGVTAIIPLTDLASISAARAEWLVPGRLRDKALALLKLLPKGLRTQLDQGKAAGAAGQGLATLADELAGLLDFARGTLPAALSEAVEVLRGVRIPPDAWQTAGVVDHLRLNLRVIDDRGETIAESRDLADLQHRLAPRARKALAALARARFARDGLTQWTFGDLPERVEFDPAQGAAASAAAPVVGYPALVDAGATVSLTLAESPERAALLTHAGTRRLLAIACRDELTHRLASHPSIDSMYTWHAPIGDPADLKAALIDLIVERTFLSGQPPIRSADDFDQRQTTHWGRLGQVTIEVITLVSRILETRHKIAARLSSGTPRTWAVSVADLREQAAYLMPRGFLRRVPFERLREYPRYVEAMWRRLTKLREDGSPREARALADLSPHWKRFTGWVAAAAARAKAAEDAHAEPEPAAAPASGKARAAQALPAARRAAPVVPTEAAAWAMTPGVLPPNVERYRWLLEEFRVSLFAQELGTATPVSAKRLDEAWSAVDPV